MKLYNALLLVTIFTIGSIAVHAEEESSLFRHIQQCDFDKVDFDISKGADVNAQGPQGFTPLHYAVTCDTPRIANLLLDRGATKSLNQPADANNITPLIQATMVGEISTLNLLLYYGADIHATLTNGDTALHIAVKIDNPERIKTLLQHGANEFAANNKGETPLELAFARGSLKTREAFIQTDHENKKSNNACKI